MVLGEDISVQEALRLHLLFSGPAATGMSFIQDHLLPIIETHNRRPLTTQPNEYMTLIDELGEYNTFVQPHTETHAASDEMD
jgi:hypothetical protein